MLGRAVGFLARAGKNSTCVTRMPGWHISVDVTWMAIGYPACSKTYGQAASDGGQFLDADRHAGLANAQRAFRCAALIGSWALGYLTTQSDIGSRKHTGNIRELPAL
jgi:hypothetical protein